MIILTLSIQNKVLMGEVMKEAAFSLAEAKFTAGDFSHTVIQNVSQAQYRVRMKKENVVGQWELFLVLSVGSSF